MQVFNYNTRKELINAYKERWNSRLFLTNRTTKTYIKEMELYCKSYNVEDAPCLSLVIREMKKEHYKAPNEYLKKNFKRLIELYVPKEDRNSFYHIISKYNQFPYSRGMDRRTVRSSSYQNCINNVFDILYSYHQFGIYECDLSKYLKNEMSEEKLDFKENSNYLYPIRYMDDIIASKIDTGDKKLIKTITDIILSENNTYVVTIELIRGIIKSSNSELHKLLGDFMLAARLQEGVRQGICENMDCGTTSAFITLFDVIYENNLIRYSSIKRGMATWIGINYNNDLERIGNKVCELIKQCITDKSRTYELTKSNDTIEILIALWTLGFYEISDAINVMKEYSVSGSKNQKLTMSYYNSNIYNHDFMKIVATHVIENDNNDLELVAAFIPSYFIGYVDKLYEYVKDKDGVHIKFLQTPITRFFNDSDTAKSHFKIFQEIYESMPGKKIEFSPCIFPWYSIYLSKSQLIIPMCIIAYSLNEEEYINYTCKLIKFIDTEGPFLNREFYLQLLLHNPINEIQMEMLINALSDRDENTRNKAYEIINRLSLKEEHYKRIEDMLKYKNSGTRLNLISIISKQEGDQLIASVQRILNSNSEETRTAGLNIVLDLKNDNSKLKVLEPCILLVKSLKYQTAKEKILVDEICGESLDNSIKKENGYGLYNTSINVDYKAKKCNRDEINQYFNISSNNLDTLFGKFNDFIIKNSNLCYINAIGDECLLGNGLDLMSYKQDIPYEDRMPFKELWCEFYESEIKDYKTLFHMYLVSRTEEKEKITKHISEIFGKVIAKYQGYISGSKNSFATLSVMQESLQIMMRAYEGKKDTKELCKNILLYIINEVSVEELWYTINEENYYYRYGASESILSSWKMIAILDELRLNWEDEEADELFFIYYLLDEKVQLNAPKKEDEFHTLENRSILKVYDYIHALHKSLITKDLLYKGIFEVNGIRRSLEELSLLVKETKKHWELEELVKYGFIKENVENETLFKIGKEVYYALVDKILDIELKRGDTPTEFSASIFHMAHIYGMERLVLILSALGKDKLCRSTFYRYHSENSKTSCLSYLLQICYPFPMEDEHKLKKLLQGSGITKERLIEVAMYAPQWIDIIEKYLDFTGLKSGCYYFMAHMNDDFDDKKMAIIARYTPLAPEELKEGAADISWFWEAYSHLLEKDFMKLYESAKYISDGSKHARARKYVDAMLDRVSMKELEGSINEKRNKDLLMSYGLIPIKDNMDILHRYEYIQKFLLESKQFGGQRRASEASAVQMALKNLATAAGFLDVTRLTMSMETEYIKENQVFFSWNGINDILVKISVDGLGQSAIKCEKDGKILKSVPTSIKNDEYMIKLKEFQRKLKEQYKRTVKMFEQAMEDREYFTYAELKSLCNNPVVAPIINNLVLITKEGKEEVHQTTPILGFLGNNGLVDCDGRETTLGYNDAIRIAHPYDLYIWKVWSEYQKCFYHRYEEKENVKQPFKQVFRELYIKVSEEADKYSSLMFAGNQIQPVKTATCLKARRWVADYEEGLQKVYYKDNIVARIYALADWFSPSDIEAPTLEWVEFFDRKTYQSLCIKDIPDIIYSEVMRDVDLAVSVAHVGGVDPETSHSTIEMRRIIIGFNLPLFKISNVTLDGVHAIVKGVKGEYSIHLGSGIIHKIGGHQINVLPVHSQHRGKLFLPFIDEDPKTAEIMSKIVLFARDNLIKDPYILMQI